MYYLGQAAFHLAALSGSEEIAKTLLDMKADINIQVRYNYTNSEVKQLKWS